MIAVCCDHVTESIERSDAGPDRRLARRPLVRHSRVPDFGQPLEKTGAAAIRHPPAPYLGRNVLAKSSSLDRALDSKAGLVIGCKLRKTQGKGNGTGAFAKISIGVRQEHG
jgi:hypothetical protein